MMDVTRSPGLLSHPAETVPLEPAVMQLATAQSSASRSSCALVLSRQRRPQQLWQQLPPLPLAVGRLTPGGRLARLPESYPMPSPPKVPPERERQSLADELPPSEAEAEAPGGAWPP